MGGKESSSYSRLTIYELQIHKPSPHMSSTLSLPQNILISEDEYLLILKINIHAHFPKPPSSPKEYEVRCATANSNSGFLSEGSLKNKTHPQNLTNQTEDYHLPPTITPF